MRLFEKMRQQKVLSFGLVLVTLAVGIMIGTLVNPKVHAARSQVVAPDATPLVIPDPVQLGNEFTKLAKKLEPSVVYITADYTPKVAAENPHRRRSPSQDDDENAPGAGGGNGSGGGDEGLDLFKHFFKNGPFSQDAPQHALRQQQSGTGFIVDRNGYIITNNHVVSRVDRIKVKLSGDDNDYRARVIGTDPETDLAVLKIDSKSALTPVTVGNSDSVQVGDWAVAIGSPFGLEASVTAGIVSALSRDIGGLQLQRFIQTDAAINPGNSGGPLLNIRGEVIGVNTMIATQSGGYQGIGFALPMNMVARVYNDIIKTGRVTRGSIGISWNKTNKPELMKALGTNQGVMVDSVHKGGPAAKAGIKDEDIIVAMNGKSVKDGDDLVARVADTPVGTPVNLTVDRGGHRMDFNVTIEDRAEVFKDDPRFASQQTPDSDETPVKPEGGATQAKFGMKIKPLTDADRESLDLKDNRGVEVVSVDQGSFAEDIGIVEKDVIVSINRLPVTSVDDIRKIQFSLKSGDAVAFRVMRSNQIGARGGHGQWASFFLSGTLPTQ
jgi:serine protease Do